jgi:1-acyl-sn-glycerol-3-phosphate acyltransferase
MHGIERDLQRPVYGLADDVFKRIPLVNLAGPAWAACRPTRQRSPLLREQQQLVMVFPEGSKGPGKHYSERYQLRRFGRAVRADRHAGRGAHHPLAIVGNEETMPILAKIPSLAKALGLPYVPITANMLVLGSLGALVPFPAKMRIRVLDPVHLDVPPDQLRYSRSRIMDTSEDIRHAIQEELYDMLSRRRSVWTG